MGVGGRVGIKSNNGNLSMFKISILYLFYIILNHILSVVLNTVYC